MFASIYTTLSGGLMQERRMEVIANNLANANTNGYKKDMPVFESYLTAEGKSDNTSVGAPSASENARNTENLRAYLDKSTMNVMAGTSKERVANENVFVKTSEILTDFVQGPLKPTGNELDLALEGKGMFGFQTDNGVMYGRNGTFHVNSNGELANADGYKLLDTSDNPVVINLQEYESVSFSVSGEITGKREGQNFNIGFLKIAEFDKPQNLQKVGSSLYRNINDSAGIREGDDQSTKVSQGFVELSNVNIVREMTDMIQANRGYQTMQKVVQSIDGINDKLIQIVGRPI